MRETSTNALLEACVAGEEQASLPDSVFPKCRGDKGEFGDMRRRRKRNAKGFAFKLDKKLLQEMAREHAREIIEDQRTEIMNKLIEQMIRGPVFKAMKLGLRKNDIPLLLCTVLAVVNAKSEEDVDRNSYIFIRAFLETLSEEELRDFKR